MALGALPAERRLSSRQPSDRMSPMDRQMPVMDGLTATRAIRAWEQANPPAAHADHRTDGRCLDPQKHELFQKLTGTPHPEGVTLMLSY